MSRPAKVTVAAPLESDTFNGAFLSPTKNIACNIDITSGSQEVRGFKSHRIHSLTHSLTDAGHRLKTRTASSKGLLLNRLSTELSMPRNFGPAGVGHLP